MFRLVCGNTTCARCSLSSEKSENVLDRNGATVRLRCDEVRPSRWDSSAILRRHCPGPQTGVRRKGSGRAHDRLTIEQREDATVRHHLLHSHAHFPVEEAEAALAGRLRQRLADAIARPRDVKYGFRATV